MRGTGKEYERGQEKGGGENNKYVLNRRNRNRAYVKIGEKAKGRKETGMRI